LTPDVVVAGAGMAGLAAAARARELGASVLVLEKGSRAGGSMLLSSGVVWRHRTLAEFHEECPGGDVALQARIVDELDAALDWLEALGAPVSRRETGNERTVGRRFDPRGLTDALVRAAGGVRLGEPFRDAHVLATGGFGVRLARERGLLLRASPWSEGDGLDYGRGHGGAVTAGVDEFYGRALPAQVPPEDFVTVSQLYGARALVLDDGGREFFGDPSWSENDLVQAIAQLPGGAAWYVVDARTMREPTAYGTVAELVERAQAAGGDVRPAAELPFPLPESDRLREPPFTAVRVRAAVTHTLGGLRIDANARVLRDDDSPVPGLYAAGADAGGIFTGGYASGLAAALVFGRVAAETALAEATRAA
jgi:succinate dehydrogenase/fumarate reductase flavoprotein subunit